MNAGPDVERAISDWLNEEAPAHAPDRILDAAARTINRTKQRRHGAAWREPMIISSTRLLAAAVFVLAMILGAGWIGRTTASVGDRAATPSVPSIGTIASTPSPSTAPPIPSASPSIPALADGTYRAAPMLVADVIARINADRNLTAAQKTHLIDVAFEIKNHTTLTVSIELRAGKLTQLQTVDGVEQVGARSTYSFLDAETLIVRDQFGIAAFQIGPAQTGFTLKLLTPSGSEEDAITDKILFESSAFTRTP